MKHLFIFACVAFLFAACDSRQIFNENHKLENNTLIKQIPTRFIFDNSIEQTCDVGVNFRFASFFPFKNIRLTVCIRDSRNHSSLKNIDFMVRNPDNSPKGETAGDITDILIPVINDTVLLKDIYSIEILSDMTLDQIPGVMELGVRVSKK